MKIPTILPQCVLTAVLALALTVLTMLGMSAVFFPVTSLKADAQLGEQLFKSKCSSCHALSEESNRTFGPSLYGIGRLANNRIDGMSAEAYLLESIVNPGAFRAPGSVGDMPADIASQLTTEDIASLVAFLASQGGDVNYRLIARLAKDFSPMEHPQLQNLDLGSLERGRQLFFFDLNCTVCHSVDNIPGASNLAPTLAGVGLHSRDYLRRSVVSPNEYIVRGYNIWSLLTSEGEIVSGRRLPSEVEVIRLATADGYGSLSLRSFLTSELEEIAPGEFAKMKSTSPMPSYQGHISESDLEALLDFLTTLR